MIPFLLQVSALLILSYFLASCIFFSLKSKSAVQCLRVPDYHHRLCPGVTVAGLHYLIGGGSFGMLDGPCLYRIV
jgi:hypothetical protein